MGNKKKFDKIERNDVYYEAYGEEQSEKKKEKKEKKPKKRTFLDMDPENVPEKIEPSTRFTYRKEKSTTSETHKSTESVERTSEEKAEKPSYAPFVFVLIAMCLVFTANLLSINGVFDSLTQGRETWMSVLLFAVVYLIPSVIYMIVRRKHSGLGNVRGFSLSHLPFTFVCLGLVLSLTALQKYAISYAFSYSETTRIIGGSVALTVAISALLPAICEELLVRGVFQYEISSYAGGFCGIVAGALVFAMLHYDFRYFLVYFVAGLVLGAITHVTGSVFPAILVHFLNNTISILFSGKLSFVAAERIGGTLLMIILAVLSFAFLIIALQIAEGISASRAAEYVEKEKDDGVYRSSKKRAPILLYAKKGQTFSRSINVFTNPMFLVCIALFIIVSATGIKLM